MLLASSVYSSRPRKEQGRYSLNLGELYQGTYRYLGPALKVTTPTSPRPPRPAQRRPSNCATIPEESPRWGGSDDDGLVKGRHVILMNRSTVKSLNQFMQNWITIFRIKKIKFYKYLFLDLLRFAKFECLMYVLVMPVPNPLFWKWLIYPIQHPLWGIVDGSKFWPISPQGKNMHIQL